MPSERTITGSPITSVWNVTAAAHEIVERDLAVGRHAQPDRPAARRRRRARRGVGERNRAAACRRISAAGPARSAACRSASSFSARAEAVVGVPAVEQLLGVLGVEGEPLRLAVGPAARRRRRRPRPRPGPATRRSSLIACSDSRRRALAVGVLDAQDERAAVVARQQPVEQRRARVADVQVAGRARGEADAHLPILSCSGRLQAGQFARTARLAFGDETAG